MILERLLGGVSPEVGRTLERALEGRELATPGKVVDKHIAVIRAPR